MPMSGVYPRVCGGTCSYLRPFPIKLGLSPRVRGNPVDWRHAEASVRSIPACAGEPLKATQDYLTQKVYPRVCGGTANARRNVRRVMGLSPRVRGNHHHASALLEVVGSIPACAGEPLLGWSLPHSSQVYPRVCGGTSAMMFSNVRTSGLSPRVRGNPRYIPLPAATVRSIPACAGEPVGSHATLARYEVYPRVCGGTLVAFCSSHCVLGLSPRVRGNLTTPKMPSTLIGSIPACAGEPATVAMPISRCKVYPRVCGGTALTAMESGVNAGLSPRVRGNLISLSTWKPPVRSIPACAGEPHRGETWQDTLSVYPRVCGGTCLLPSLLFENRGLSPRVRGNLVTDIIAHASHRSIPACAGEPRLSSGQRQTRRVYPRVCGGTVGSAVDVLTKGGLSPRVRGNRRVVSAHTTYTRSIPACAGEPSSLALYATIPTVYPRVCGGTYQAMRLVRSTIGLSPRVRGNHAACLLVHAKLRSIPACAGEPWQGRYFRRVRWVYPRVCGGTLPAAPCPPPWTGLSPRVRGNRAGQRQR